MGEAIDSEPVFANEISDKEPISRIYKDLSKLKNKKTYNLIFLMDKNVNRCFSKEDLWMENTDMKSQPTSLVIGEMQLKTTFGRPVHRPQWLDFNDRSHASCQGRRSPGTLLAGQTTVKLPSEGG